MVSFNIVKLNYLLNLNKWWILNKLWNLNKWRGSGGLAPLLLVLCNTSFVSAQNIGGGDGGFGDGGFGDGGSYGSTNSAGDFYTILIIMDTIVLLLSYPIISLSVLALVILCYVYMGCYNKCKECDPDLPIPTTEEYLRVEEQCENDNIHDKTDRESIHMGQIPLLIFPKKCAWFGYYNGTSSTNNGIHYMNFDVMEIENELIRGRGSDEVGYFEINGKYSSKTCRVAFDKWYINKHHVEYRGQVNPKQLGSGIRGNWYVNTERFNDQGDFRMWFVDLSPSSTNNKKTMCDYNSSASDNVFESVAIHIENSNRLHFAPTAPSSLSISSIPTVTYIDAQPDLCFICFENNIDSQFWPCQHIVACNNCANKCLATAKKGEECPMCRQAVTRIIPCTHKGSHKGSC